MDESQGNQIDRKHLFETVKRKLVDLIADMPGDTKLPSRNALASRFGVARTTIERAVSELIGEGALYARDGSGTYVAGATAQSASSKSGSMMWGVIVERITHPNTSEMVQAIEDMARQRGFSILLGNEQGKPERLAYYVDQFVLSGVRGLVICPGSMEDTDPRPFAKLAGLRVPFVFAFRQVYGVIAPKVVSNNFHGGYLATAHLIARGYRRIAYVSPIVYASVHERLQGYMSALSVSGTPAHEDLIAVRNGCEHEETARDLALELLASPAPPDAFFCFNDIAAKGVYAAIRAVGKEVGRDVGLVGYDDTSLCEELEVKLTSVRFPRKEMGQELAQLLLRMMDGEGVRPSETRVLMPTLVVRQSTCRLRE